MRTQAARLLMLAFTGLLLACPASDKPGKADEQSEDDDDDSEKKKEKKKKKKGPGSASASAAVALPPTATAAATAATATAPPPTATAAPPLSDESFFAGPIPAGVKLKPIRASAMDSGALTFQPVEGYSGGKLPGNDYMSFHKDHEVVFRLDTSSAVVSAIDCSNLSAPLGMAPALGKDVKQLTPAKMRAVGRNNFAAREGSCSATGKNGELEVHFIDIARGKAGDEWHYAVMVSFPKSAPASVRDEAKAWARSLEFTGVNAYKL